MPSTEDIPADFLAQVDEVITRYPVSKRSASLPLLHLWQERFGHISEAAIDWIAAKLDLQPINILELVTFYPMFRQQPIGKIHFRVCRTLSCALGGSHKTYESLKKLVKAEGDPHGPVTSPCGNYTVEFVECLASCGTPPVVMVNDDFYEKVDEPKAKELLAKYKP